jgi:dUTP pyrophosphatase
MKIKPLHDSFQVPEYKTEGAAGFDVRAHIDEPATIAPNEVVKVPLGFAAEVPEGFVAGSGLGADERVVLANTAGVIDSDYRGEWVAALTNDNDYGSRPVIISPMQRVAQVCILPVSQVRFDIVASLPETRRGSGGFGHSGKD